MTELIKMDGIYEVLLVAPNSYKHGARRFVGFLRDNEMPLNASSIYQYSVHVRSKYTAANSVNYHLNAMLHQVRKVVELREAELTVAQRHAIDRELKKIKRRKVQTSAVPQDRILTPEEVQHLIYYTEPAQTHISLMLRFLWQTGCRVAEMSNVKLSDLRPAGNFYEVRIQGKGDKERTVRVSKDLIEEIKACGWFKRGRRVYLFETPYRKAHTTHSTSYVSMRIARAAKVCLGREHISAHTIRHSLATYLIKTTGRIKAVANLLGHSSPSTTLKLYVHDDFTAEELGELW